MRLLVHLIALSRAGGHVARWRLETYGVYMPSYPHQRPWWAVNPKIALLLASRLIRYRTWLREMEALRRAGAAAGWRARLSPADQLRWRSWISTHNAPDCDAPSQDV